MGVVLYDYDGVLVESLPHQHAWYGYLCAVTDKQYPYNSVEELREHNDPHYPTMYAKLGFEWEKDRDFIWKEFIAFFKDRTMTLVPGIKEHVAALHAKGHVIGVASSNGEDKVRSALTKAGLNDFSVIVGHNKEVGDHLLKPHPYCIIKAMAALNAKPEQTVYIGDMTTDIEAALRVRDSYFCAPVMPVAVAWGWQSPSAFSRFAGLPIATTPQELTDIVLEIFGH